MTCPRRRIPTCYCAPRMRRRRSINDCWECLRRIMTIAQTNERHTLHRREPLLYVFLRDDRYACRAEEHVSASVIKVPMDIHYARNGADCRFEDGVAELGYPRIHSA